MKSLCPLRTYELFAVQTSCYPFFFDIFLMIPRHQIYGILNFSLYGHLNEFSYHDRHLALFCMLNLFFHSAPGLTRFPSSGPCTRPSMTPARRTRRPKRSAISGRPTDFWTFAASMAEFSSRCEIAFKFGQLGE